MKSPLRFFSHAWRPALLVLCVSLIAYLLYFHNLAHLLPGYDSHELAAARSSADWHSIAHNPVNAPYKLLVWAAAALGHHSVLVGRYVAAAFGILGVVVFFLVARPWYGFRVALLGTILFATSAGFLHAARLSTANILQMGVLIFVGAMLWYRQSDGRRTALNYLLIVLLALLWYIPGMIWFELLGLILLRNDLLPRLRRVPYIYKVAGVLLFLAILVPLGRAIFYTHAVALQAAGLPDNLATLRHVPHQLLAAVLSIGIHSNGNPELWVGHLPLLNIIEIILGLAGAYYYLVRERSIRSIFLLGSVVLSLVLISLGGAVGYTSLVPLLYLLIASGVEHLLGRWLAVFPRNPIARSTGVVLICIMLFFSVLYQVRSYFVAWPHAAVTRQTFDHKQ